MTKTELTHLYRSRKEASRKLADELHGKLTGLSWLRVTAIVLFLLLLYTALSNPPVWLGALLFLSAYAYLVKIYNSTGTEERFQRNLSTINENEERAQGGDHSAFEDGAGFIDPLHPYAVDLDIFGKGSLFQRFNRTVSESGREELANILKTPLQDRDNILARQRAVEELAGALDFRQSFQAVGMDGQEKKDDLHKILHWLKLDRIVHGNRSLQIALIAIPALTLLAFVYWLATDVYYPAILMVLIQWAIVGSYTKRVQLFHAYIGSKKQLLEKYAAHFDLISKTNFSDPTLTALHQVSTEAKQELASLAARSRALDLRLNFFSALLLNTTVLYDLQCVLRLEQWREKNKLHLERWLTAVHEFDALNSLAAFACNNPSFIFPDISERQVLEGTDVGHPLIAADTCVTNPVSLGAPTTLSIVTGANMAGKSTYLRAVGVNVVLALTGSVVFAKEFTCPLMEVHTGMRNTDSINENQSYFFAELLRLHKIVVRLKEGVPMFILLDEILKGTNSGDKLTGSEALVQQLVHLPCLGIVATHDLALGDLQPQYPDKLVNHHFETAIRNDELFFDYTLKPGVSTSKNATFLMRKMGIIPS